MPATCGKGRSYVCKLTGANHELLVINEQPDINEAFRQRWDEMAKEVGR